MVRATVRKDGDRFLIEVSSEDGARAGLRDGQEIELDIPSSETASNLDPKLTAIASKIIHEHREALDYRSQCIVAEPPLNSEILPYVTIPAASGITDCRNPRTTAPSCSAWVSHR